MPFFPEGRLSEVQEHPAVTVVLWADDALRVPTQ